MAHTASSFRSKLYSSLANKLAKARRYVIHVPRATTTEGRRTIFTVLTVHKDYYPKLEGEQ